MIWVTILLSVIEAIPRLLPVIREIWDAIHHHPAKVGLFVDLMQRHAGDPAGAEHDLLAFHAEHVLGYDAKTAATLHGG